MCTRCHSQTPRSLRLPPPTLLKTPSPLLIPPNIPPNKVEANKGEMMDAAKNIKVNDDGLEGQRHEEFENMV
jgi:hypothetical protein